MCAFAVRLQMMATNPVEAIDCPRSAHKERPVWTKTQMRAFLAEATKDGTYGPLWQLLAEGGLRREDALGLRWRDVDFTAGKITIRQAVVAAGGKTVICDKPKTPAARRSIALSPGLVGAMAAWQVAMGVRREAAAELWKEHDLCFPTTIGTPINPNNLSRVFLPLIVKANVPRIRIHDIRHTSATLALEGGGHMLAVSQRLGHARPSTTANLYGHTTQGMADGASLAIAAALYGDD
jgi:integrase